MDEASLLRYTTDKYGTSWLIICLSFVGQAPLMHYH